MTRYLRYLIAVLMLVAVAGADAQKPRYYYGVDYPGMLYDPDTASRPDSLAVSLLTCMPGPDIYELCGHSAVRIRTLKEGRVLTDSIWNFGIFDFSRPGFVYRFVKGETDYMLGTQATVAFLPQYFYQGRGVVEQHLNLNPVEAANLRKLLQIKALPANREYRYNYVKDNCSTSIIDCLDSVAQSHIIYPDSINYGTFRREMAAYHEGYPWYQFGIDLALGSGIDYKLSPDEEMFVPVVLMERAAGAHLADGRKLVNATEVIFAGREGGATLPPTPWYLGPLFWSCVAFAIAMVVAIVDVRRCKVTLFPYVLWFTISGLAGCLLTFLIFISVHEATSPNVLLLWLNPLALIVPIAIWWRRLRGLVLAEMLFALTTTGLLLIAWPLQHQSANIAFFPLMGVTVILASAYSIVYHRRGKVSAGKRETYTSTPKRKPTRGNTARKRKLK